MKILNILGPIFCFRSGPIFSFWPGLLFFFQPGLIFFSDWCGDRPSRANCTSIQVTRMPRLIHQCLEHHCWAGWGGVGCWWVPNEDAALLVSRILSCNVGASHYCTLFFLRKVLSLCLATSRIHPASGRIKMDLSFLGIDPTVHQHNMDLSP